MSWIGNWVADKAAGVLATGIQAGGNLAGNAVGGVGTLIESTGRGVGNSTNGAISGVGNTITGYGNAVKESTAPSGSSGGAEKKTAVKPTPPTKKAPTHGSKPLPSAGTSASRLSTPASTKARPVGMTKGPATTSKSSIDRSMRPPISTGQSAKTADGKVKISPSSRPRPAGTSISATSPSQLPKSKAVQGPRVPAAQKTSTGKVKISPASRPRAIKA